MKGEMKMRSLVLCLAMASLVSAPMAAMAESPWTVKIGVSQINPKSGNGSLAGGAFESEVSTEVGLTPAIEYKFAPNIVGEVLLAIPFKHDVKDTLTNSKIASFKHLPPTFTAKYLFTPEAVFSPYVGLGLNYTLVYGEETTGALTGKKLKGKDSFGLAATVGFEYRIPNSQWGVAADLRYVKIKSDLTLDGTDIGSLTVDPTVLGVSAVYHY
jgi:outer membrane protein